MLLQFHTIEKINNDYFLFVEHHKDNPIVKVQTLLEAIFVTLTRDHNMHPVDYDDGYLKWRAMQWAYADKMRDLGFVGKYPFSEEVDFKFRITPSDLYYKMNGIADESSVSDD